MRRIANLVGVILTLLGILWILQGTNIITTGVMAGQTQWAIIGFVVGIVGVGLLVYINRRPGSTPRTTH